MLIFVYNINQTWMFLNPFLALLEQKISHKTAEDTQLEKPPSICQFDGTAL